VAEQFLAERSVQVGRDARLGVERYSTPELLERERALVAAAVERRGEGCAQVRSAVVRSVLDRHPTAGDDQAAMVEDVCRSGAGVSLVVGRAGSGKTWALGLAREALELDGYRVLGAAPTGIATVGLADEGFTQAHTVDRLLLDLQAGRTELDGRTVLVVDEAAMVATRKLAPLLGHAERAGAKVVLVGDDRQFASIAAGGGFRALRLRLGASELTVNRRQVEAWEQRAIEDVRAGNLEQAIAAYAEHDRIRAFEARDDRDRALVADWWQAHQAGEQPVIYAHRRAQVDQLNSVCQRLRAEAGQLGPERLAVGDRTFVVGDVVVLGVNAKDRLGVVNGTTAIIAGLDLPGRAMTVHTLEDEPPRTVRLPRWYLDAAVRPGQSRRVDLAYARTDMRSQGRTERRALLALDGAEDMQGAYVQLTRSKHRTDLYLTVGPESLRPDEERPHPAREARASEEVLARVLTRDGSKTLATDTPNLPDVRRWSTAKLRAERDRLAQLRSQCPPDRSRELRLATVRAAEAEQARQQARIDHQAAAEQVAALAGSWRRRGERTEIRERLVLAEHGLRIMTGQADQAAERLGVLRRAQQRHLGWKPTTPTCASRSGRWPGRMPGGAGSTSTPWPWTRRAGWWPNSAPSPPTSRSGGCGARPPRNWTATGAPTAWTTHRRRSIAGAGWPGPGGRLQRPALPRRPMPAGSPGATAAASAPTAEVTTGRPRPWWSASGTRSARSGCWAPSPAGRPPVAAATGRPPRPRSSGWPAGAATAITATTATSPIPTAPTATGPAAA
jgi:AAA domain